MTQQAALSNGAGVSVNESGGYAVDHYGYGCWRVLKDVLKHTETRWLYLDKDTRRRLEEDGLDKDDLREAINYGVECGKLERHVIAGVMCVRLKKRSVAA